MLHPAPPLTVLPILPTVYLMKTKLHPLCQPAHVTRDERRGMALVQLHVAALMAEIVMWSIEHLTDAERIAIRNGFGVSPDLSVPFADGLLDGVVGDATLPACLELVPESHPLVGLPRALRSG